MSKCFYMFKVTYYLSHMNTSKLVFSIIFFSTLFSFSFPFNETQEFIGTIQLSDKTIITYKLQFEEYEEGKIKGKSITDFSGAHRTESTIKGRIDRSKKSISFEEVENVTTKSDYPTEDFCYVHLYNAKIKLGKRKSIIQGHFFSRYKNGDICVEGDIYLIGEEQFFNKMEKLSNRKIVPKKNREVVKKVMAKSKANIEDVVLRDGEQVSITTLKENIQLKIFDNEYEDGDQISVSVQDSIILENYVVKEAIKTIDIPLVDASTRISIKAENDGRIPPNSASVLISNTNLDKPLKIKLNKGKEAVIVVNRAGADF